MAPPRARSLAGPTGCQPEVQAWLGRERWGQDLVGTDTDAPLRARPSVPGNAEPRTGVGSESEKLPGLQCIWRAAEFHLQSTFRGVVIESA